MAVHFVRRMNPLMAIWLQTLGAVGLAIMGGLLGRWFSRKPAPYWTIGYFIPLGLFGIYFMGAHFPALAMKPPVSWMMEGRNRFALAGFVSAMIFATPLSRVARKRERVAVFILMVCAVAESSAWPFLAPAFNRDFLAGMKTQLDSDGVCLQSSDYTCGPAAAVTALRRLGFPAEEGEIGLLAHTSSATGTPPDILAQTLNTRYARDGLICQYRVFESLDDLKQTGLTLAVVKYNFMADHYVTVLELNDHGLILADPLTGITRCSREEFSNRWRHSGVVLRRQSPRR